MHDININFFQFFFLKKKKKDKKIIRRLDILIYIEEIMDMYGNDRYITIIYVVCFPKRILSFVLVYSSLITFAVPIIIKSPD